MTWLDVYDLLVIFSLVGLVTIALVQAWAWWTRPVDREWSAARYWAEAHDVPVDMIYGRYETGPGTVHDPRDPSPRSCSNQQRRREG